MSPAKLYLSLVHADEVLFISHKIFNGVVVWIVKQLFYAFAGNFNMLFQWGTLQIRNDMGVSIDVTQWSINVITHVFTCVITFIDVFSVLISINWGLNEITDISRTEFLNTLSWMEIIVFWF